MQPLTHHDILELVRPFSGRGRHVDLAATDRLQRRIAFKSVDHPPSSAVAALHETLVLEDLGSGSFRLTRRLTPEAGPTASLEAVGSEPAELLARIDDVPPHRQFHAAQGTTVGVSFRLAPGSTVDHLIFTRGTAQVAGLEVILDASTATRGPAAVAVKRTPGDELRLPQDALAVLGRQWSRFKESEEGWSGELRLAAREPRRSRQAEAGVESAALHLAHMLAEAPQRFHERWMVARWRVFCRHLVPLAVCIGLIVCAANAPKLHLAENSGLRMLILNSPPILMIIFFCLREIPVVEIPPLPRRSVAAAWREARTGPTSAGQQPRPRT